MAKLRLHWTVLVTPVGGDEITIKARKGKPDPNDGKVTVPDKQLDEDTGTLYNAGDILIERGGSFHFNEITEISDDIADLAWETGSGGYIGNQVTTVKFTVKAHHDTDAADTPYREWRDLNGIISTADLEALVEQTANASFTIKQTGGGTPSYYKRGIQVT